MAWGNTNINARGGSGNSLFFKNIVVPSTSFITYTPSRGTEEEKLYNLGYICRANVPLDGCLGVMTPDGTMSMSDIKTSGVAIASQVQCYDGGIYLYATGVPNNDITILNLELSWSANITVNKIATPDDIGAISANERGVAGGVASLGDDGKVPAEQLPEIGAVKSVNGQTGDIVTITAGTTELETGISPLGDLVIYCMYEE